MQRVTVAVLATLALAPAAQATITGLSPSSAEAGGAAFTLTITGTDFTAASTAKWGTSALSVTYVSATELTAAVAAGQIADSGTVSVTVTTADGALSSAVFTIYPPQWVIAAPAATDAAAAQKAVAVPASPTASVETASVAASTAEPAPPVAASPADSIPGVTAAPPGNEAGATIQAIAIPSGAVAASSASSDSVTSEATTPSLPAISSLSQSSAWVGAAAFTLTVYGTNFLPGSLATVVSWSNTQLTTTYVSSTQVTAAVPASLLTSAGTFSIVVITASGSSSSVSFTVNNALPKITNMSPSWVYAGSGGFVLQLFGSNFGSAPSVSWGGTPMTTTGAWNLAYVTIPASLVATAGTVSVTLTIAAGTSVPVTFTIKVPLPTITSISQTSAAAGGPAFTLTVYGTNFSSGSIYVVWGCTWLWGDDTSPTQFQVTVPANLIASAQYPVVSLFVAAKQGYSNSVFFTINPSPPAITTMSPASVMAGSEGFTLTINGTAFTADSTATWGTTPLYTVYQSPTQLTASVPASLLENAGAASVTVTNSIGTSSSAGYTITQAPPSISGLSPFLGTAGGPGFTLSIYGEYFTSASIAKWGSTALATTYISQTQLTASVPANLIATTGKAGVSVSTSAGTANAATFTINPAIEIITAALPSGSAGNAYSGPISVTGGTPGYIWTVSGLPANFTYANTMDSTLTITGTPASPGAISIQVSAQDTFGATAGPVNYTINVSAGPNGARNGSLNGSYVCLFQGSIDYDGTRWATVASFQADGDGNFTNGVFDANSHDIGSASGTINGSYNLGSDYNGMASIHTILTNGAAGVQTTQWALSVTSAAQPAQQFRLVESDDLGTLPSGQQGTANCYLATPSAFSAGTVSGSSFVFALDGEDNNSNMKMTAGRFSALNGAIAGGKLDTSLGGSATVQTYSFAGSYTAPDPIAGRCTISLNNAGASTGFTVYIIDANRMFLLDNTSNDGEQAGEMRAQQQASYTGASISGAFVLYRRGAEFKNGGGAPSGFYAEVFEGAGNGAGNMTINQSYENADGVYTAGSANGGPAAMIFDSANPGRATVQTASGMTYLYLFNSSSAVEMSVNSNGSMDSGWLEAQTQSVFTDTALSGDYLFGELPVLSVEPAGYAGEYDLSAGGAISGAANSSAKGVSNWDQSISMTYGWDTTAPGTGGFLIANGNGSGASCAAISATKFVCVPQSDPAPGIQVMQE
jgi:hypothetical protein